MKLEKLADEIAAMQRIAEQIEDPIKAYLAMQITDHCRWSLDSIAELPGMIDDQIDWWPSAQFDQDRRYSVQACTNVGFRSHVIKPAIVKLGSTRRRMVRHRRGALQPPNFSDKR